ncbi:hypothetical protein AAC387_Pa04g1908 [Persea americana]
MAMKWLSTFRRKFTKSHHRTVVLLHDSSNNEEDRTIREEEDDDEKKRIIVGDNADLEEAGHRPLGEKRLSEDDLAAIKIQAFFRGHLARRAFRALRSLVKLQALVRGFCVRRQARIALYCMHTLVRLQVRVRARQLLSRSEDAQVPHHPIYSTLKP